MFWIVSKLPTKKKTIVFESFLGKQYSDNPKALYLYIKKHYPEYKLYWSITRDRPKIFEENKLSVLPRFGLKWVLVMARAEYWITNSRLPLWLPKPKGTIYVQTWHGTPLKKLALDMDEVLMPGTNTKKYKKNFLKEASKWDYLISPNRYSTNIFKSAFNFNRNIIESGYPRNDILKNGLNKENIINIKRKAKLPVNKKILLYAPTWRDNQFHSVGKYKFNLQLDLNKMKQELGDEYIILLRLHYLVSDKLNLLNLEDFVYDFSTYEDINELYLISDMLITDYSSVFFDYAVLKRPIFFYAYDLEDYRDKLRGFYFDFIKDAPGPIIKSTEKLIDAINSASTTTYYDKLYDDFFAKFCYLEDGKASEKVVSTLFRCENK